MPSRGLHTSASSLQRRPILAMLFGIAFLIFMFQKKKIFSPDSGNAIFTVLKSYGISNELSAWMTAQAAFETADFNSFIFRNNNNAFGMKYAGQTVALGEKNGYAYYKSVTDSVADLVNWYNRHRRNILSLPLIIFSLSDYVSFLKNQNYFEDSEAVYLAGVQYYYNKYFHD